MSSITPRANLRRRLPAVLLTAVAAGALAAGCGGGGGGKGDAEGLLDRAFRQPVKSADVNIDAELKIDGLQGFEKPVKVQAAGPYVGGGGGLPRLDIDLKVGSAGAGQTVESGFLSTGDRAFVKFGGVFYEQPRADVARANRELRKQGTKRRGSLGDLGLNPRAWISEGKQEGSEKVAGVDTEHVSGKLDVRRMFSDVNKLVQRSAGAVGGAAPGTPDPLTAKDLDKLAEVVEDPTFDVYVGKDDDTIRRVSANLQIKVPKADQAKANGIKGGSLQLTIELAKVNGSQKIEAPAKARPIADLTKQLGGASALSGLGGADADPGTVTSPGAGGVPSTTTPDGTTAPSPDTKGFKAYSNCLDKARPDDTKALSRCAELLR
jgi:hypothetical protein